MDADHHSRRMVDYTLRLLKKFNHQPSMGLDLCCGAGTAVSLLGDAGLTMSGLDGSGPMLKVARQKLIGRGAKLYRQEMPKFVIRESQGATRGKTKKFDLVTCFYDSLNYLLTPRDLSTCFQSVHRHLQPGGYFIFDMNTPNALKTIWGTQSWAGVKDDLAWIFRSEYIAETDMANCHTTFFLKEGKSWQRFDELHTERGYSDVEIRRMLRRVGFQIKGYYRCLTYEKATPKTNRICVVAKRVAGHTGT